MFSFKADETEDSSKNLINLAYIILFTWNDQFSYIL